jgi:hypothetical protein
MRETARLRKLLAELGTDIVKVKGQPATTFNSQHSTFDDEEPTTTIETL